MIYINWYIKYSAGSKGLLTDKSWTIDDLNVNPVKIRMEVTYYYYDDENI